MRSSLLTCSVSGVRMCGPCARRRNVRKSNQAGTGVNVAQLNKTALYIGAIAYIHGFGSSLNEQLHFHVCAVAAWLRWWRVSIGLSRTCRSRRSACCHAVIRGEIFNDCLGAQQTLTDSAHPGTSHWLCASAQRSRPDAPWPGRHGRHSTTAYGCASNLFALR